MQKYAHAHDHGEHGGKVEENEDDDMDADASEEAFLRPRFSTSSFVLRVTMISVETFSQSASLSVSGMGEYI